MSINLAMDAAAAGRKVTLVDFDIVNPYFRASDYARMLKENGVKVISPMYAGSTVDLPMLSPEIHSVFHDDGVVLIDAGGDDAGAVALGSFAEKILAVDYDMLYVVNQYRALSATAEEALALLHEIERASHIKATAIINNSHLMQDTTPETIIRSFAFAGALAAASGLPVRATVIPKWLADSVASKVEGGHCTGGAYPADIYVRPPWAD